MIQTERMVIISICSLEITFANDTPLIVELFAIVLPVAPGCQLLGAATSVRRRFLGSS
jgi:hypothetical protein